MIKIRVTRGGCGVSYEDEHGVKRHALKTPEDGPFMCDEAQAARLVRLGVAAYVTSKTQEEQRASDAGTDNQNVGKPTGHFDADELEGWDYYELKKLAADLGVAPAGKKKSDLIAAIAAVKLEPGGDTSADEVDGGEDDAPPVFDAADPE